MGKTRLQPSQDSLKSFNFSLLDIFAFLSRVTLIFCLVSSISLVLYSSFATRQHWLRSPALVSKPGPDLGSGPTNISHILFGIGGSAAAWHDRSRYSSLWWKPSITRGFVWFDKIPRDIANIPSTVPPRLSSRDWTKFRYSSSRSAVRIARIIKESFELGLPHVRWFVMGDDDTVFYPENLVSLLRKYDHDQMWYIGGNSESVEQDERHSYDMAFGGGGFAISYVLAEKLVKVFDGCLDRYHYFYGSDQRVWACVSEIGVPLTMARGFHQFDIRGSPYGVLAAHPLTPLISLHHLDYLDPIFPNQTKIDSLKALHNAYRVDPPRILQQSLCYDYSRRWSISISWGYTIRLYLSMIPAMDLQSPLLTFKTWASGMEGPFTFNTRRISPDPCEQPIFYLLDRVEEVERMSGTLTSYNVLDNKCNRTDHVLARTVQRIVVSAMKMDPEYWNKAPQRQCCEIKDRGSMKDQSMRIRIRKCRPQETVTII
ncbi:hypothetical protein HS088_TW09G00742 [Tripterygium wilfordii]|uniref:Uncharacterized protein n=1 Tax=Tripterygium wilfordii TaxID=458696 RepID=A0A7J7D8J8_TRIWF|nr:uncharacterized protein LOC120005206 [Tripterygium wilfordii]KAF5742690.1 hypothetical protein HS088_TW09G00742 [Tripterygium wilfordii]